MDQLFSDATCTVLGKTPYAFLQEVAVQNKLCLEPVEVEAFKVKPNTAGFVSTITIKQGSHGFSVTGSPALGKQIARHAAAVEVFRRLCLTKSWLLAAHKPILGKKWLIPEESLKAVKISKIVTDNVTRSCSTTNKTATSSSGLNDGTGNTTLTTLKQLLNNSSKSRAEVLEPKLVLSSSTGSSTDDVSSTPAKSGSSSVPNPPSTPNFLDNVWIQRLISYCQKTHRYSPPIFQDLLNEGPSNLPKFMVSCEVIVDGTGEKIKCIAEQGKKQMARQLAAQMVFTELKSKDGLPREDTANVSPKVIPANVVASVSSPILDYGAPVAPISKFQDSKLFSSINTVGQKQVPQPGSIQHRGRLSASGDIKMGSPPLCGTVPIEPEDSSVASAILTSDAEITHRDPITGSSLGRDATSTSYSNTKAWNVDGKALPLASGDLPQDPEPEQGMLTIETNDSPSEELPYKGPVNFVFDDFVGTDDPIVAEWDPRWFSSNPEDFKDLKIPLVGNAYVEMLPVHFDMTVDEVCEIPESDLPNLEDLEKQEAITVQIIDTDDFVTIDAEIICRKDVDTCFKSGDHHLYHAAIRDLVIDDEILGEFLAYCSLSGPEAVALLHNLVQAQPLLPIERTEFLECLRGLSLSVLTSREDRDNTVYIDYIELKDIEHYRKNPVFEPHPNVIVDDEGFLNLLEGKHCIVAMFHHQAVNFTTWGFDIDRETAREKAALALVKIIGQLCEIYRVGIY